MLKVEYTTQFKRDLKLANKRKKKYGRPSENNEENNEEN